ncbi:hypothetical protein ACHAXA_000795 [Cyclostephanos tholiformis]|uniref:UNC-45/Cro1/She4 central domain-containing protein n=1 Tax=Cyclostephanos tholiformis TaxID=382380 RepID=A0ABD3R2C1_9STRA
MTTPSSSSSSLVPHHVEELKSQGNGAFRKGNISLAIQCYTSALECINDGIDSRGDCNILLLASTLLSNRAMCELKLAEVERTTSSIRLDGTDDSRPSGVKQGRRSPLRRCIDDCTAALARLDDIAHASGRGACNIAGGTDCQSTRGKILYRRSRALVGMASGTIDDHDEEAGGKYLNDAARDLLQLLSFDPNNREATSLLRTVRYEHERLGGGMGRSRISRSLDRLRSFVVNAVNRGDALEAPSGAASGNLVVDGGRGGGMDALSCLRVLQASLADEVSSSAEEIGRRGGVSLLLQIVKLGMISSSEAVDSRKENHHRNNVCQCRVASLHVLSACCTHEPFVIKYGNRDSLPPELLAQITEEEAALSAIDDEAGVNGSVDVAVAVMALLVRLIVHWELQESGRFFAPKILEDGSVDEGNAIDAMVSLSEVEASSICRVLRAAFLWGQPSSACPRSSDSRPPRAAIDILSSWTASDLDALDAAYDACYAPSSYESSDANSTSSMNKNAKKASRHRITPDEIRKLKPRQVATHRKREAEYHRIAKQRAIRHVSTFCSTKTGGLDAMLSCAAQTNDHRLRRELGLQIGRLMSVYCENDNDEVKKLVYIALGCTNWKVGNEDGDGKRALSSLSIEELHDDDENEVAEYNAESASEMFSIKKRAQLTASLLLGKPEVGIWALKHGWSDSNGVKELKLLISSNDSRAMSIASEIVSAASSVESARPFLATLVKEGTLEDLLIHPHADVRSGAASCMAKIGLASKSLSTDEGEVVELLDVAIELLFEEEEGDFKDETRRLAKQVSSSKVALGSTSMERGVEVLAYLVSKTFVKEKIASGYVPDVSPTTPKSALQRLVEIACCLSNSDSHMAYGLAGIFNLIAVSIETLRKEAFIGKEITQEQYDQLQALGKTEEEKKAAAKNDRNEGDNSASVRERIQKLANANVPFALVKLLEGSSSDATQTKVLEGMGRMASEPVVIFSAKSVE